MPLYTPFFERGMATIEQGRERGATRDAAKSAYMSGDLSGLYAQNPELANQMEGRQLQRQQVEGQNAATQQRAEQARAASERQAERDRLADEEASNAFYNQMAGEVANIDDFETAKAYVADQINRSPYKEDFDIETFTPEQHEQYKQVAGVEQEDVGFADQRARKIDEYQDLYDLSVEEATRRVDQDLRLDDKGNLIIYDPTTDAARLANIEGSPEQDIVAPPSGTTVEDLSFDPGKGTGFGASFLGLWNSSVGQLPFMPIAEGAEESAQNLRLLERDAIRALAVSGRPPVVEQERISALIPNAMAWTQNPDVARFQMTNFIDLMMNQYTDDIRFSGNSRNPKTVREESTARAKNIESIIRRVLTPDAASAMFDSLSRVEGEMGEVRDMSSTQLMDVDPDSLTPAQLDIYIERLREK